MSKQQCIHVWRLATALFVHKMFVFWGKNLKIPIFSMIPCKWIRVFIMLTTHKNTFPEAKTLEFNWHLWFVSCVSCDWYCSQLKISEWIWSRLSPQEKKNSVEWIIIQSVFNARPTVPWSPSTICICVALWLGLSTFQISNGITIVCPFVGVCVCVWCARAVFICLVFIDWVQQLLPVDRPLIADCLGMAPFGPSWD